jgi:hypothetical protein
MATPHLALPDRVEARCRTPDSGVRLVNGRAGQRSDRTAGSRCSHFFSLVSVSLLSAPLCSLRPAKRECGRSGRPCSCCLGSAWRCLRSRPTPRVESKRGTDSCTSSATSRSSSRSCSRTSCSRGGSWKRLDRSTWKYAPLALLPWLGALVLPDGLEAGNYLFFAVLFTPLLIHRAAHVSGGWLARRTARRGQCHVRTSTGRSRPR